MAVTSLRYSVLKETKWDYQQNKEVTHIVSKGFEFFVDKTKTEEEHNNVITSFENYLASNGYNSNSFGSGTWAENFRKNTLKDYIYLDIPVLNTEEKEEIQKLYKQWKNK